MKAAIGFALLLALAVALPRAGYAQSFVSTSGGILNNRLARGDLVVHWSESGLTAPVDYTISGTAGAVYACVNSRAQCNSSQSVAYSFGPLSPLNGSIQQTAAVQPVPAPSACGCAGGDTLVLYKVSYTGLQICDDDDGPLCASIGNPGFSATLCKNLQNCPPAQ